MGWGRLISRVRFLHCLMSVVKIKPDVLYFDRFYIMDIYGCKSAKAMCYWVDSGGVGPLIDCFVHLQLTRMKTLLRTRTKNSKKALLRTRTRKSKMALPQTRTRSRRPYLGHERRTPKRPYLRHERGPEGPTSDTNEELQEGPTSDRNEVQKAQPPE